jgi:hypothetical protein
LNRTRRDRHRTSKRRRDTPLPAHTPWYRCRNGLGRLQGRHSLGRRNARSSVRRPLLCRHPLPFPHRAAAREASGSIAVRTAFATAIGPATPSACGSHMAKEGRPPFGRAGNRPASAEVRASTYHRAQTRRRRAAFQRPSIRDRALPRGRPRCDIPTWRTPAKRRWSESTRYPRNTSKDRNRWGACPNRTRPRPTPQLRPAPS